MDGEFHYKDNNMSGQTVKESKAIDDEKDRLAKEHNIEVIRINCSYPNIDVRFDYIKQNILLNSRLNELFNLSKIDWLKAEEFALSNRVKEACALWNSGIHSTIEIGKIMKLSNTTTRDYLKKGVRFEWCSYDVVKEKVKGAKKMQNSNKKPVKISKGNNCIGIFESAIQLSNISEELLGIKLNHSCICHASKDNKKYKNYDFEYVKEII